MNAAEVTTAVLMSMSRSVSSANPFISSSDPHLLGDSTGLVGDSVRMGTCVGGAGRVPLGVSLVQSRTSHILEQSTMSWCFSSLLNTLLT